MPEWGKVKKEKRERVFGFVWLAMVLLSACRSAVDSNAVPQTGLVPMRVVTDDFGRTVTIPTKVRRVVSTAPSVTENIFAVGAGDMLVGVTTFCNYPEEAKSIAKIGDTMTPNIETIIALKPDVVFVSTASQIEAFMKTLEANGIAVYVTNPKSFRDVIEGLKRLAIIFCTEVKSEEYIDVLWKRYADVNPLNLKSRLDPGHEIDDHKARRVRVFIQISREPLFTIGKEAFLNDLIFLAGGKSVTAHVETAYPKLSKETASALNPDAIILSESDDNKEPNDALKNSPAVKNGRIYKVNADLLSRPGPRLVDALEQIAKQLHPEKFK